MGCTSTPWVSPPNPSPSWVGDGLTTGTRGRAVNPCPLWWPGQRGAGSEPIPIPPVPPASSPQAQAFRLSPPRPYLLHFPAPVQQVGQLEIQKAGGSTGWAAHRVLGKRLRSSPEVTARPASSPAHGAVPSWCRAMPWHQGEATPCFGRAARGTQAVAHAQKGVTAVVPAAA